MRPCRIKDVQTVEVCLCFGEEGRLKSNGKVKVTLSNATGENTRRVFVSPFNLSLLFSGLLSRTVKLPFSSLFSVNCGKREKEKEETFSLERKKAAAALSESVPRKIVMIQSA